MLKTTAQDLAWADVILDAIKARDRTELARILAAMHERAVSCAAVRRRRTRERPSFNHSRADGPYDPCAECLALMTRKQLLDLVRALRG